MSLAACYLGLKAKAYYRGTLELYLNPVGRLHPRPLPDPADGRPVLLLLGDSRLDQWGQPQLSGYQVLNHGISGQTSEQIRERCTRVLEETRPAVAVLQFGVNDLKAIGVFPERAAAITSRCLDNVSQVARQCRAAGARVLLTPVLVRGRLELRRRPVWSHSVDSSIHAVNDGLGALAEREPGIELWDLNALLSSDGKLINAAYQTDALHLNPAAYALLRRNLEDQLAIPALQAAP